MPGLIGGLMDQWESVLREHGDTVWRTIGRLLGSQEGAADCFQEAFVDYARIAARQAPKNPLALLKRIATRRAIDEIRRRMMDRKRLGELNENQVATGEEPWESASAKELDEKLREALAQIPEDQAAAFSLTQIEGMENGEAGEAMRIDGKHVSVLLHRARANLQGRLAKYLPAGRRP
jgi:RNA polymerase sigma-70 factor (ECF subfamily)